MTEQTTAEIGASGRKVKPHGTNASFARGCKDPDTCPNTATGGISCYQANRDYHNNYVSTRRTGTGRPNNQHGTPTGYQYGCHDRSQCPATPTCADASLAAERARRRAAGIPAAPVLTDSTPARTHVTSLQRRGMGLAHIAAAAGVSFTSLCTLVYGRYDFKDGARGPRYGEIPKRIRQHAADSLLDVEYVDTRPGITSQHGTRSRYKAGCRLGPDCPSALAGGLSCTEASNAYQKRIGSPFEVVRWVPGEAGAEAQTIAGVLIAKNPTTWRLRVNGRPVDLPRDQWIECIA